MKLNEKRGYIKKDYQRCVRKCVSLGLAVLTLLTSVSCADFSYMGTVKAADTTDNKEEYYMDPFMWSVKDIGSTLSNEGYEEAKKTLELVRARYPEEYARRKYELIDKQSPTDGQYVASSWDYCNKASENDADFKMVEFLNPTSMSDAKKMDKLLRQGESFCAIIYTSGDDEYLQLTENVSKYNKNGVRPSCELWKMVWPDDNPDGFYSAYYFPASYCKGYVYANKWVKKVYKNAKQEINDTAKRYHTDPVDVKYAKKIKNNIKGKSFSQLSDTMKLLLISYAGYFGVGGHINGYGMKSKLRTYEVEGIPLIYYTAYLKPVSYDQVWEIRYKNKAVGVCADYAVYETFAFRTLGMDAWGGYALSGNEYYYPGWEDGERAALDSGHAWTVVKAKNGSGEELYIPFDYTVTVKNYKKRPDTYFMPSVRNAKMFKDLLRNCPEISSDYSYTFDDILD